MGSDHGTGTCTGAGKKVVIDLTFRSVLLRDTLFKNRTKGLKIILFSASGEARARGKIQRTPAAISCRLMWRPRIPANIEDVVNQLAVVGVALDGFHSSSIYVQGISILQ